MKFLSLLSLIVSSVTVASLSTKATTRSPNPVVNAMANGMTLLKPVFVAEAKLQATLLGGAINREEVSQEIEAEIKSKPIVIYTYGLSPFSTEAVAILDSTGYEYKQIELGAGWFVLGGKESVKRVLLSEKLESGATSLPKVFVNGQCLGGCAELTKAVETGALKELMTNKKSKKMFSFL